MKIICQGESVYRNTMYATRKGNREEREKSGKQRFKVFRHSRDGNKVVDLTKVLDDRIDLERNMLIQSRGPCLTSVGTQGPLSHRCSGTQCNLELCVCLFA